VDPAMADPKEPVVYLLMTPNQIQANCALDLTVLIMGPVSNPGEELLDRIRHPLSPPVDIPTTGESV
jgi:hypothetical protein